MTFVTKALESAVRGKEIVPVLIRTTKVKELKPMMDELRKIRIGSESIPMFRMFSTILPTDLYDKVKATECVEYMALDMEMRIPESTPGMTLFTPSRVTPSGILSQLRDTMKERVEVKRYAKVKPEWWQTSESRKVLGAHKSKNKGKGIKIAIIDSDSSMRLKYHPQVKGRAHTHTVRRGMVANGCGHGAHCYTTAMGIRVKLPSGIVCEGIAPEADGMAIKCLYTPMGMGMTSDILKGVQYAINHRAHVLSLSLGGPPQGGWKEDPLCIGIHDIRDKAIVVAAIGNDGKEGTPGSPALSPEVISVGATDKTGTIAPFSTTGPTVDGLIAPTVVGPGVEIYSGIAEGTALDMCGDRLTHGYTPLSGSSMITPAISGLTAILLSDGKIPFGIAGTEAFKKVCEAKGTAQDNVYGFGIPEYDWF